MLHLKLIAKSLARGRGLFLLWIVSLAISVSGLLIVDVFRQSLVTTLKREGRQILTADASISTRREFKPAELENVKSLAAETSAASEILAMASFGSASRLAGVRFIEANYPLYGDLQINQTANRHGENLKPDQAWIAPDLLPLLKIKLGDEIQIGRGHYRVTGLIKKDPAQSFRFGAMAPRIYLRRETLAGSGLVLFGSTYTQTLYLKTSAQDLKPILEREFADPEIQVTVPEDLEQGSFRILSRLLDFLGLTGLVTLALGWIGIYYLGRRWLALEATPVGMLKCLGFGAREIFVQLALKLAVILSLGIALGALLALTLAKAALPLVADALPEEFRVGWSLTNSALLLLVGPVLGLLLLFPSLISLGQAKALELIRGESEWRARRRDLFVFGILILALFSGLTLFEARSWRVALIFMGGLSASLLLCTVLAYAFVRVTRRWRGPGRDWKVNAALASWAARRSLAVLLITVSALSGLLAGLIPTLEKTLVGELRSPRQNERPALFLIDIQDEQIAPLREFLLKSGVNPGLSAPFVRARIVSVNGETFERAHTGAFATREEQNETRFRNRGVNLSYRKTLSPFEHVIRGAAWSAHRDGVSVEKGYAERMNLKLGDTLTFDVQGLELQAKIQSLREVDWDSFEPNFFILFPDGILNDAPKTWIETVKRAKGLSPSELQSKIALQFPNVTSIDIDETLDQISALLERLSGGLKLASALSLGLGIFVFLMVLLFQLASSGKDRRQLRLLGVRESEIVQLNLLTYGGLCLFGLLLGSLMSLGVAFALARFAFSASLRVDWPRTFAIFTMSLLVMIFGLILMTKRFARRDRFASL